MTEPTPAPILGPKGHLVHDDRRLDVDHREEWEAVYVPPEVARDSSGCFRAVREGIQQELHHSRRVVVFVNRLLKSARALERRRSRTSRTEQRLESAQDKLTDYADDLQELEREIAEEIAEIHDEWMDRAVDVDELSIGLEKSDVVVDEVAVAWVPTA